MRLGQDGCAAIPAAAPSAELRSRDLAPEPGPVSARACRHARLFPEHLAPAMFARAAIVASLLIMAAAGPAQGQTCAGTPTRACVLEQALAAARAIADEGARAQALGQIGVLEGGGR